MVTILNNALVPQINTGNYLATKASTNPSSNMSKITPKTSTFGDKGQYTYNIDTKGIPHGSPINTQSTTAISSDKTADILAATNKLNQLSTRGATTDANTGAYTLANGQVAQPPEERDAQGLLINPPGAIYDRNTGKKLKVEKKVKEIDLEQEAKDKIEDAQAKADAYDNQIIENINEMSRNADAQFADDLFGIKQKFDTLRAEQREQTIKASKNLTNSLLMGGATGQGSSAQFAPISSEGIISANEAYGIKQLSALNQQESELIAAAREAQRTGKFKALEAMNKQIETKRKEKADLAIKLNEELAERSKKAREANLQSSRDSAIADLYSQGIIDTVSMLDYLNYDDAGNKVGDFTAKEVAETLKNIVPPGLDDLVKTLRTNGAPQDVIQKVISSKSINDAYSAAGNYGAGGAGIIGEYNFYKAQAEAAGQVPVDFNTYQNQDANRKKSIAAAGIAGSDLSTKEAAVFNRIVDKYNASPAIKALDKANLLKNIADEVISNPSSATNQLALIYSYIKGLDTDSAVKEGEIDLVRSIQSYTQKFQNSFERITNGKPITSAVAIDIANGAKKLITSIEDTARRKEADFKAQAKVNGTGVFNAWNDYRTTAQEYKNTGDDIVISEASAQTQVDNASINNPEVAEITYEKLSTPDPTLGRVMTYSEVLQYLQAIGKI
jgi:hypothetical protein